METLTQILAGMMTPRRLERMEQVLDRRLGAVRLVVEDLRHPHNMSAVLRSCEAMGVQHVHAVESEEDFTFSRSITKGSHKWLTLHRHETFEECAAELRREGFALYAAMLRPDAMTLEEVPLDRPVALVLGNELKGVRAETLALCDGCYMLPMEGFVQSYNVSVAAALSLHILTARVRRELPDGGGLPPEEKAALLEHWLPRSSPHMKRIVRALTRSRERTPPPETP